MTFVPFAMERWQSTWEFRVAHNLSESGVHPLSLGELCDLAAINTDELAKLRLGYSQTNGTEELRERIASLYSGATVENVLVTTGSAEANFLVCWNFARRDTRMSVLAPTYMQTWGLGENLGAEVTPFHLREELGWDPEDGDIRKAIGPETKLVAITNPNNPTGHVLSRAAVDTIVTAAEKAGAWILSDEVYRGAELSGETTQSLWNRSPRVLVTAGLSKAYGLPGLRIGWVVGPADIITQLWSRHDYTVIGPSPFTDLLARHALSVRPAILERTRALLRNNLDIVEQHLGAQETLHWVRPEAGAICYLRYDGSIPSLELAERLRTTYDTLIVPGAHFHMEPYLRIGYGEESAKLDRDLSRLRQGLEDILG